MALSDKITCTVILVGVGFAFAVVVFALSISLTYNASSPSSDQGSRAVDSLKFVIVVSRHGNRRYFSIPNDPYPLNDSRYWQYGLGELTTVGRVQMYKLGAKVRTLYNGFLNTTYYSRDFHASSTKLDRTMESGSMFLAGLYPPRGFQRWDENIDWQPIPLPSDSQDKTVEMTEKVCPRFKADQINSVSQFMAVKNNSLAIASVMEYLNPYIGYDMNQTGYMPFSSAWDTFISEETEGYALPSWVDKVYPEPMKTIMSRLYVTFFAGTDVMPRLIMGSFYRELVETLESKVNGTLSPDRKMFYYSGHDSSLLTLQYMLGIPKDSIGMVTPGSAILYELHQNATGQFYLQVLYIDGASANLEPVAINITNCASPCDIHYVINYGEKFYNITDYNAECQLNFTSNT